MKRRELLAAKGNFRMKINTGGGTGCVKPSGDGVTPGLGGGGVSREGCGGIGGGGTEELDGMGLFAAPSETLI